jgi:glyoxylase-like metal-dependent hydrolase (beta-lactamase superfamily II)
VQVIADRTFLLDLLYLGNQGVIACGVLETADGLALVDPGPATTLEHLAAGLAAQGATLLDVRHVLATHIHLDHTGVVGALVREQPALRIHVHERGAPHLADPARLLKSATRIYGADMERLWGTVLPVPVACLRPLAGGERLRLGGRLVVSAYTPGHASHHLAWLDESTGLAFTGDVAGERRPGMPWVLPVTPPPDIDVELLRQSGLAVLAWRPGRLFLTHFGPHDDPEGHLRDHDRRLVLMSEAVRTSLEEPRDDDERAERFAARFLEGIRAEFPEWPIPDYYDGSLRGSWTGLARYWRKRLAGSV